MDFYQKNPLTLRKLLAKRQNPSTQIFKQQPSNTPNHPKNQVNPPKKAISRNKKDQSPSNNSTTSAKKIPFSPNILFNNLSSNTSSLNTKRPMSEEDLTTDPLSDSFESIHKKVKTSTLGTVPKKSSFDEDKDSDHSTNYETHSEGSPNNDARDFLSSPSLLCEPSKEVTFMKLDDETPLKSDSTSHGASCDEDTFVFVQVQSQKPEDSCSYNGCARDTTKVKCEFRHRIRITSNGSRQKSCPKCEELLGKCQSFARFNNGTCLNEKFEETIRYMCSKGHEWNVPHRKYDHEWCAQCAQDQKDFMKRKCEEERRRREKEDEEFQQKLFEEARQKALGLGGVPCQEMHSQEEILAYFQRIDFEVEKLAKEDANKFMAHSESSKDVSYQQALQVYKVLFMPEEILQKYMLSLGPEVLKSEFRRMAKIIHPDKNKHPNAGNAFQKVYKVYEEVVGRFEGS